MSNPTVVEYCLCDLPRVVFDDETDQSICTVCGGVIYNTERVIVNLTMIKLSDKVLELAELQKYQATLLNDLTGLLQEWARVLTPPSEED